MHSSFISQNAYEEDQSFDIQKKILSYLKFVMHKASSRIVWENKRAGIDSDNKEYYSLHRTLRHMSLRATVSNNIVYQLAPSFLICARSKTKARTEIGSWSTANKSLVLPAVPITENNIFLM